MMKKRVLISGMGVFCSNGRNTSEFTDSLIKGRNAATRLSAFDTSGLRTKYACEIKDYQPLEYYNLKELKRMDRSSQLCLLAVKEAINTSGISFNRTNKERIGVCLGTTVGGMVSGLEYYKRLKKNRIYPSLLMDQSLYSSGNRICAKYGLLGPNIAISTACSSSNVALGYAYDLIKQDLADVVVTGGFDTLAEITFSGFGVLRNMTTKVCRPFDKNRNGMILGEGAGCLIFEEEKHCKARGGRGYAEFLGYGMSSDAYHMTSPDILGRGAARSMINAMENSGISEDQIDYINAHGTGTKQNDKMETYAIKKAFHQFSHQIPVSSSKSMFGHTLGAAGAIEAITCIIAIQHHFLPPTINYQTPDPKLNLDYVPNESRNHRARIIMSNNFGFGGSNCSIIMGQYKNRKKRI